MTRPAARRVAGNVAPAEADVICAAVLELCRRVLAEPGRPLDPIHPGPDPVALALQEVLDG